MAHPSRQHAGSPRGHSALDAQAWLAQARACKRQHVDPYAVWALQTGFRQFALPAGGGGDIEFIVEMDAPYTHRFQWPTFAEQRQAWVPGLYGQPLPGGTATARHITLHLPMPDRVQDLAADISQLMFWPGVKRLQIGVPRPAQGQVPRDAAGHSEALPWCGKRPPQMVLGILDDSCPFAHPALRMASGHSRVAALWDQSLVPPGARTGPAPQQLAYGTQVLQADLNRLMQAGATGRLRDEAAIYREPASRQAVLQRRSTHAAAVLTLLAGDPRHLPTPVHEPRLGTPPVPEAACHAAIVAVQFPLELVSLAGGRWLAVRALDGLRYLAQASCALAPGSRAPLPLVANLSYGSVAGAHDGTALLETAMDELCRAHRHMAVVLAAGNAHGARRSQVSGQDLLRAPSGAHAAHQIQAGESVQLRLSVAPDKSIETYLELWFRVDGIEPDQAQPLRDGEISLTATGPTDLSRPSLALQACPDMAFQLDAQQRTTAGLLLFPRVSQSLHRTMALLVLAATERGTARPAAPSGVWTLTITNRGPRSLRLEAWVDRDVTPGRARHSQAARLLPADGASAHTGGLNDRNTFSNVGTGAEVFRVGALTAALDAQGQQSVSPYSASAGSRAGGPEFSALADQSPQHPGIRVSGSQGGMVVRMNGTSMAAPQAARWLANQMGDGQPLPDIRAALKQSPAGNARRGRAEV